ncbi:hypothetical protein ACO0K0_18075 [Undibacterium sp. SXout11W]
MMHILHEANVAQAGRQWFDVGQKQLATLLNGNYSIQQLGDVLMIFFGFC